MPYKLLADVVMVFHWVWIIILFVCLCFLLQRKKFHPAYGAILTMTAIGQVIWEECPFLTLEKYLRSQYDSPQNYGDSFIVYWLHEWFDVDMSPLVITYSLWGIVIITIIILIRRRIKRRGD